MYALIVRLLADTIVDYWLTIAEIGAIIDDCTALMETAGN